MNESVSSMLLSLALLGLLSLVALALTIVRPLRRIENTATNNLVYPLLFGIGCHGAHAVEEFLTGFHLKFPQLFGLQPISGEFFVTANALMIVIWLLAAAGIRRGIRIASWPVWIFALAMSLNGVAHPLLAAWTGGYFPGLITSPLVGVLGVVVGRRLLQVTDSKSERGLAG